MANNNQNRAQRGSDILDKLIAKLPNDMSTENINSSKIEPWHEAAPILDVNIPTNYPIDALPEKIRLAVLEVQSFIQAPVAMVASSAIASVSISCQGLANVKRENHLVSPISVFTMILGESGERKTTCDNFFSSEIREHERRQKEIFKSKIAHNETEIAGWKASHDGILAAINLASKKGNSTVLLNQKLMRSIDDRPTKIKPPRLLYSDSSTEALTWNLFSNIPSGGVFSSEAGLVLGSHSMNGENIMRNLSTLNVLWEGGALTVDRMREGGSYFIETARLTVSLQTQPKTLFSFIEKSNDLARGSGFFARFLIAYPESTQGKRFFKPPPATWPSLSMYNLRLRELLALPIQFDDEGVLSPEVICFDREAKSAWIKFHDAVESKLIIDGELSMIRDAASKIADNAARLAALFHIFENGLVGTIGIEAFEGAARIATWHLLESKRILGNVASSVSDENSLDEWLIKYCNRHSIAAVSTRMVQQCGPSKLRNKSSIEKAVLNLQRLNRCRFSATGDNASIEVNPSLLGVESNETL